MRTVDRYVLRVLARRWVTPPGAGTLQRAVLDLTVQSDGPAARSEYPPGPICAQWVPASGFRVAGGTDVERSQLTNRKPPGVSNLG